MYNIFVNNNLITSCEGSDYAGAIYCKAKELADMIDGTAVLVESSNETVLDYFDGSLKCCFCGTKLSLHECNNPWPVNNDFDAHCCNSCNATIVIPARIRGTVE